MTSIADSLKDLLKRKIELERLIELHNRELDRKEHIELLKQIQQVARAQGR
jgi:hypothetical protein